MTYKNAKTILFASLIVAMILPFSGMLTATAQSQKVVSDTLFTEFVNLADKTHKIQELINQLEHDESNKQIKVLQTKLASIKAKMVNLQQQNIDAVERCI